MLLNYLQKWEIEHRKKIISELKVAGIEIIIENIPRIIEETSFRVRREKHPDECPYYKGEKSCHPEVKDLNCFLCACPNYLSEETEGGCKIKSKRGRFYHHPNLEKGKVWDCSDCPVFHSPKEIEKYLKENIGEIRSQEH